MNLIPYSDSDEESNEFQEDHDQIIEVTQKRITTEQFNFGTKSINRNNKNISLDFSAHANPKSLFNSLPIPTSSAKTSLHEKNKNKKKKIKKKKKKKKQNNDKKRKLQQLSLIDILPEPKHKKRKISPKTTLQTTLQTTAPQILDNKSKIIDEIQTNDIRKKQAEVHRKYKNPLATFSISNQHQNQIETDEKKHFQTQNDKNNQIQSKIVNGNDHQNVIGPQFQTASSIYRVDNNNNHYDNDTYKYQEIEIERDTNKKKEKDKEGENEEIINISHSDLLGNRNDKKQWIPTFEIDDITHEEIKIVPTNTYNVQTGKVEKVTKYTKTQKKKHQINTLAYEAQEKALQLAMRRSASYKTKSETQAKYGW